MPDFSERTAELSRFLTQYGVDAYLVPTQDEFQGEYTPPCAQRLAWLSGFTGSAGAMLVGGELLANQAVLFVDGRYTVQGAQQCGEFAEVINIAQEQPLGWVLKRAVKQGKVLKFGYDPALFTVAQVERWGAQIAKESGEKDAVQLVPLKSNLVDALWGDRPAPPCGPIKVHPIDYAGKAHQEKIAEVVAWLERQGADAVFLSRTDSIAWLLNIRGSDVPYNPLVLSYALVQASGEVSFFVYDTAQAGDDVCAHLGGAVSVHGMDALDEVDALRICYEAASLSDSLYHRLAEKAEMVATEDPCTLPKAIKNATEIEGMRAAHVRDGVALTKFLAWLEECFESDTLVDELGAEAKLQAFRAEQAHYQGDSFATIAGAGSHGAIVHYRAVEASNRTLQKGELLLVDSGGQYLDGTTDVTRTVVYGEPSAEQVDRYTRVLKGHIAVDRACFPEGTTGAHIDAFARGALWEVGMDYAHGTGHGVGSYLCVHEGPQGISSRASSVALKEGMILSNEPGYYKEGEYGIRIENLVLVVKRGEMEDGRAWLGFETLTKAPLCETLIDRGMLTTEEIEWLDEYQKPVITRNE